MPQPSQYVLQSAAILKGFLAFCEHWVQIGWAMQSLCEHQSRDTKQMRGMKHMIKRNIHIHSPESASWLCGSLTASVVTARTGAGKLVNIPGNRYQWRRNDLENNETVRMRRVDGTTDRVSLWITRYHRHRKMMVGENDGQQSTDVKERSKNDCVFPNRKKPDRAHSLSPLCISSWPSIDNHSRSGVPARCR